MSIHANALSRLKWEYKGNGQQTANWHNYGFAVTFDLKNAEGRRWHLAAWEKDRETLTKGTIFESDSLPAVYQYAERLVGELAQFMDIAQVVQKDDRHALDLEMHIFEGAPPEFRTSSEVVDSIREASVALRHAAVWLYGVPLSKDKLPIVEALARSLSATADDTDKRLVEIEWSLRE